MWSLADEACDRSSYATTVSMIVFLKLKMPDLPNDVLTYIVEAVYDPRTQWALLTVCRQMSRLVLPSIYRKLSFDAQDSASDDISVPKFVGPLEKLALVAESNPNLQFTTSLYFFTFSYEGNELVASILPFLGSLRRLAIYSYFFHPDRLLLLPPTAKLTHLILTNIKYSSFLKVIESHPTLRTVSVQDFRSSQPCDGVIAIPQIRLLTCPIDSAHQFGHRPSVTDVCFTISWRLRRQPIPEQSKDQVVKGFPFARAAHFPDPFDFPGIASLACRLSSLQYLLLDTFQSDEIFKTPFNWNLLSTTKLKYIRIFGSIVPIGTSEDVACAIFDAVQSVALVDVNEDVDDYFQRFYRHLKAGVPVLIYTSVWQPWWESVKEDIDDATTMSSASRVVMLMEHDH